MNKSSKDSGQKVRADKTPKENKGFLPMSKKEMQTQGITPAGVSGHCWQP